MEKVPSVGKTYNCFDDGKIRVSRRYDITVKSLTPFDKADSHTLNIWKSEVKSCYWLYNTETDFFVLGVRDDGEKETFVRTVDGGWFGIGGFLNCGRLDIDGKCNTLDT